MKGFTIVLAPIVICYTKEESFTLKGICIVGDIGNIIIL